MVVILKRNGLDVGGVHGEIGNHLVFAWYWVFIFPLAIIFKWDGENSSYYRGFVFLVDVR